MDMVEWAAEDIYMINEGIERQLDVICSWRLRREIQYIPEFE